MAKRILIIDDEISIGKLFERLLRGFDCEVVAVTSGPDGIEEHRRGPCDLVFLDLNMPEMSGVDVLWQLRELDRRVPIYLITGFYNRYARDLQRLRDADIDFEMIIKPFETREIKALVADLLALDRSTDRPQPVSSRSRGQSA